MTSKKDAQRRPTPDELTSAARQLAKRLIYRHVERGDSLSTIKKSHTGMAGPPGYAVQVGGWMNGKVWSTDFIIVSKVDGHEVNLAFKLREIYREVRGEIMTARDLEDFRLEPG